MDLKKLIDNVKMLWRLLFGGNAPQYVITTAVLLAAILAVVFLAAKLMKELQPFFYNAEKKRRARRRRIFAEHIAADIRQIDLNADWSEERFSDLEAEVEAEGVRRRQIFRFAQRSSLRRERSLSRALRRSDSRLILLEGEPGAGKSVALRHLAHVMATSASNAHSMRSVIPLYINLKTIERPAGVNVDVDLIRAHVLKTLNRANSRDVEEFLDDEFALGVEEGTWLFLFDSFDEIPDVLSATSADTSIREYGEAIAGFLTAMNRCRGVIASRYFRGPGVLGWPRFRILALGDDYRRRLIRRADLPKDIERDLIGRLELAGPEFSVTSRNPMFLGLLCQHMRKEKEFPANAHVVFEDYVETRLRRDEAKLLRRFGVGAVAVREAAEKAAFCMAYHPTLGLSPQRTALADAMTERGYAGDAPTMFDALEFIKLARSEGEAIDPTFTFAHRRFQEYFATSVVLDAPDIVTPETLLMDARWRETAVVLLQTQTGERLDRIVATACDLLEHEGALIAEALPGTSGGAGPLAARRTVVDFPWPSLALHLLSLIQSGYQGRAAAAPERLRDLVGWIVNLATAKGSLYDRRWALEVAGVSPEPVLIRAIRDAFAGGSLLLADVAYRQAALLQRVPDDVARAILSALVKSHLTGRLKRERDATFAHLKRIPRNRELVDVVKLLLKIDLVDLLLHGFVLLLLVSPNRSLITIALPAVTFSALISRSVAGLIVRVPGIRKPLLYIIAASRAWPLFIAATVGPFTFGCVFLAVSWAPCAWYAAYRGRFVSPAWWAILNVVTPFLFVGVNARSFTNSAWQTVIENFKYAILFVAMFGMVTFLVVNPFQSLVLMWVGRILLALLSVLIVAAVAFALFTGSRLWWRDELLWHRCVRRVYQFKTADEFTMIFREFKRDTNRSRLVQRAKDRSMLMATSGDEQVIRRLAIELENERAHSFNDLRESIRVIDDLNVIAEQMRLRLSG
ncbi:MAG TPA: NACHT domain-containing protein [Thermoanaerobaculia bacterium]|jgi:hypothetical protein|nr:NACHT domain-containing protein [Thermoanaerobaculia bacterium]